jgi:hypothetical protein
MPLVLLLLGAGVAAWLVLHRSWPHGQSPLDNLPADAGLKLRTDDVSTKSGRDYKVITFAPNAQNKSFLVAESKDRPDYVRLWHDRTSGTRTYHSAFVGSTDDPAAQAQRVAAMRQDWAA